MNYFKYILIIVDPQTTSFCYYKKSNGTKISLMDIQTLKDIVFFAKKEGLIANFLIGKSLLPQGYKEIIDSIDHIIISDSVDKIEQKDDILIIDGNNIGKIPNSIYNVILKIEKSILPKLPSLIKKLHSPKRINVVLSDVDHYTTEDLLEYKHQLKIIGEQYIKNNNKQELNILSDRLMLNAMHNCDAGVIHYTFAPDKNFYICPGFYYDKINSIGNIDKEIRIPNENLYSLEYAPICKKCDAYQCRRCIYLNYRTTLEVNIPSHEQCVTAHYERNISQWLNQKLNGENIITDIDYIDPFEKYFNK